MLNIKTSVFNLWTKVIAECNISKYGFIQQAIIEKMMYSELFRREILKTLEQDKDIDYYDTLSAFKKLDAIQEEYQSAAQKIVKIVYQRMK